MENLFLNAAQARRSIYSLGRKMSLTDSQIQIIIEQAILQAPAAFGVQPTRLMVLFHQHHEKFWDIVLVQLKKIVSANNFTATEQKIAAFKAAYATVLFFEDQAVIESLQGKFALYADQFPGWGLQAQGIVLYSVWAALANAKIGASIQHYNPLIDNEVRAQWQIPESWILLGQMPIGNIETPPAVKPAVDVNQLVKIYN